MTRSDFYKAAGRTKLTKKSIRIAYSYLIDNLTLAGTAEKYGVGKEKVRQVVARIKPVKKNNPQTTPK